MKKIIVIALLLISCRASCQLAPQEARADSVKDLLFPDDNFMEGWKTSSPQRRFAAENLYGYINGGAELFLEFGFIELIMQHYQHGTDELSIEVYRMEIPAAALGIYLMKCGKETPNHNIPARNTSNEFQCTILKGSYFILINNFAGDEKFVPVMEQMAQTLCNQIPSEDAILLFAHLPQENLINGSEFIFRGPYALQPVYTFGEGDIFQLNGKIFGVAANYRRDDAAEYTYLVIPYPDIRSARSAYHNLLSQLDPYLRIIDQGENGFVFQDYQSKYGLIEIKDTILSITIKLSQTPVLKH